MRASFFFKLPKSFILILFILLFSITTFAQSDDSLYYTNPNYHVAKELFNRKIVMLADYGHNEFGPYNRLVNVLNNWIKIGQEKANNFNLTLVLETDEQKASMIHNYLLNGEINPIIENNCPGICLQTLECYKMLKKFYNNLEALNKEREYKLSFKIVGFEQTDDSNYVNNLSRLPQKESELWFINVRDSALASEITYYHENNPDEQILIFYGAAHLQNGFVDKLGGSNVLSKEERMGYFLASYLKKQLGDSTVITYNPFHANNEYRSRLTGTVRLFKDDELENMKNEEFIFKPKDLMVAIFWDTLFDYHININENPDMPIYSYNFCSRYIFEKTVEKINSIKNSLPGYKASSNYYGNLKGLKYLTGIDFANDTELNTWVANNTYNGIDWLYNDRFSDTIKMMILRIKDKRFVNSLIRTYGLPFIPDSINITDEKWIQKELPKILEQIKFTNSIGIYWLGYPDEQVKAKEYLKEFSGEDFVEPEKYLQWYRKKYYGVEY